MLTINKITLCMLALVWPTLPTMAEAPTALEDREKKVFHVEGWHIKADLLQPTVKNNVKLPMVVMLNKAAGDREVYRAFARKLLANGFATLRVDLRGHGESVNLDTFDYKVRKNFEVLEGTYKDIATITDWVRGDRKYSGLAIIGASYSGEHMMKAAELSGWADAYIALAPGSLSDESIDKIDPSGKPFYFLRAEKELPFFDEIFAKIDERSQRAKIKVLPGDAHASDLIIDNAELEDDLIEWLTFKLK